jgi:hypothetical protein
MRRPRNVIAAAVGGFVLLCTGAASAQQAVARPGLSPVRVVALATGSIGGVVRDESGAPVPGAMVSAVGTTTAFAFSDRGGKFELTPLTPGAYLVRAHLAGFAAPRGELVQVQASTRASSSIQLRRSAADKVRSSTERDAPPKVLSAAVGGVLDAAPAQADPAVTPTSDGSSSPDADDDHGEVAWRLRHARRGILKDVTLPDSVLAQGDPPVSGGFAHATDANAHTANLFAGMPLTGQVNVLATGSFDTPQQLFTSDSFSRNVTFVSLAAPAGDRGNWSMRGAITSGDISSWFVAAAYTTRAEVEGHRYAMGLTYSTQRYDGGNPAALRDVRDGSRNVGAVYASDAVSLAPNVGLNYGGTYARYDYLSGHGLFSPQVEVTVSAVPGLRLRGRASSTAIAPGAEEFLPPDTGVWLPPQRTFSAIVDGRGLSSERTTNVALGAERDIRSTTVSFHAFRQRVNDQLATIFGLDSHQLPNASVGHYFVGRSGDLDAAGWSAAVTSELLSRVRGSIEYMSARADWIGGDDAGYMMIVAPAAVRPASDHVRRVSTSLETTVPETATRILVVYGFTNASPRPGSDAPTSDARFDVQVHQSLPFMDFSSAKWEMLLAVRNFFREASPDASIYDELLVIHPPKRLVGGLTVRF